MKFFFQAAHGSRDPVNSSAPSTSSAPTVFTFDDIASISEERRPVVSGRQPTRPAPPIPYPTRVAPSTSTAAASSTSNGNSNPQDDTSYESVFLASSSYPQEENGRTANATSSRYIIVRCCIFI